MLLGQGLVFLKNMRKKSSEIPIGIIWISLNVLQISYKIFQKFISFLCLELGL
jgi:hypothetical protein